MNKEAMRVKATEVVNSLKKGYAITSSQTKTKRAPVMVRRPRGPSYPRQKPPGPFEAVSFNNRTGFYLRTRHHSLAKAQKRLEANALHHHKHIVDHTIEIAAAEREAAKKAAKKSFVKQGEVAQ